MAAVIKIVERADHSPSPEANQYVVMYDHDGEYGRGLGEFSANIEHALLFPDKAAAMEFWQRTARWRATRPDGEPNRPLTAYTVEIEEITLL